MAESLFCIDFYKGTAGIEANGPVRLGKKLSWLLFSLKKDKLGLFAPELVFDVPEVEYGSVQTLFEFKFDQTYKVPYSRFQWIRKYFKNESAFDNFLKLTMSLGFSSSSLGYFLEYNGEHRGIGIILGAVKSFGVGNQAIEQISLEGQSSRYLDLSSWQSTLHFDSSRPLALYRGTALSLKEISRILALEWNDYFESYDPKADRNPMDDYSGGKYFSLDRGVAARFAVYKTNGKQLGRMIVPVVVEIEVSGRRVAKRTAASRYSLSEIQYDPDFIHRKDFRSLTLLLPSGEWFQITNEDLSPHNRSNLRKRLSKIGIKNLI